MTPQTSPRQLVADCVSLPDSFAVLDPVEAKLAVAVVQAVATAVREKESVAKLSLHMVTETCCWPPRGGDQVLESLKGQFRADVLSRHRTVSALASRIARSFFRSIFVT
jgi:hypothetical protein